MGREAGLARWMIAATLLASIAGCQGLFGRHGLPEDPLFVDRKPLESKADTARAVAPGWTEPAPPTNPYFASQRLRGHDSNGPVHPPVHSQEREQVD
jgi:hypothetical protein